MMRTKHSPTRIPLGRSRPRGCAGNGQRPVQTEPHEDLPPIHELDRGTEGATEETAEDTTPQIRCSLEIG